jgi:FixJ family two-component response regulator
MLKFSTHVADRLAEINVLDDRLTQREQAIVDRVAQGLNNRAAMVAKLGRLP